MLNEPTERGADGAVADLFCTDGACMASTANQNPSITYLALTARAAARAVELMRRREL